MRFSVAKYTDGAVRHNYLFDFGKKQQRTFLWLFYRAFPSQNITNNKTILIDSRRVLAWMIPQAQHNHHTHKSLLHVESIATKNTAIYITLPF